MSEEAPKLDGDRAALGDDEDDDAPAKPQHPPYAFLGIASGVFLAADLLTKWWAVSNLTGKFEGIPVIEGFFRFDLAKNKGGAWGVLGDQPDGVRLPFFFFISALAVAFIVSLYKKLEPRQVALKWALPLVLGGALGNLVDRVRYQHVIDFIDMFYVGADGRAHHWPTYNVADIWIVAGVGLMVVDMFSPRKPVPKAPTSSGAAARPTERAATSDEGG